MTQLTDFGENQLADFIRGQGLTLPASWRIAAGSAASDSAFTEISGSGVARFTMTRSLTNWAGTQGPGTTLASTGSSHTTSNNVAINLGTATAAVGTVTHIGFFDSFAGGNCWIWVPLDSPIVTANGVAVLLPIASVTLTLGLIGGMTDYLSNKMLDLILRGQAYTWPATVYAKAMTAAPNNAGGGTEVVGGVGYTRAAINSTLANWSGTQAPGSVVASSGTGGRISNNSQITFSSPTGAWGAIVAGGIDDAASAGNPLFWSVLAAPKTIGVGVPLVFGSDKLGIRFA